MQLDNQFHPDCKMVTIPFTDLESAASTSNHIDTLLSSEQPLAHYSTAHSSARQKQPSAAISSRGNDRRDLFTWLRPGLAAAMSQGWRI